MQLEQAKLYSTMAITDFTTVSAGLGVLRWRSARYVEAPFPVFRLLSGSNGLYTKLGCSLR